MLATVSTAAVLAMATIVVAPRMAPPMAHAATNIRMSKRPSLFSIDFVLSTRPTDRARFISASIRLGRLTKSLAMHLGCEHLPLEKQEMPEADLWLMQGLRLALLGNLDV